ncbi:MAG: hypothetical protein PHR25_02935 [Clostridia bacterium]|nr:hypothetical protein [Clostridia bacterium]MDD4375715.1 hypothetical protein [Clostridia bacterium]
MEETKAWKEFEGSGKINDYLKYKEIKKYNNEFSEELTDIKGDNFIETSQSKRNSDKGSTVQRE